MLLRQTEAFGGQATVVISLVTQTFGLQNSSYHSGETHRAFVYGTVVITAVRHRALVYGTVVIIAVRHTGLWLTDHCCHHSSDTGLRFTEQ